MPRGIQLLKGLKVYDLYVLCRAGSHGASSTFINTWNCWRSGGREQREANIAPEVQSAESPVYQRRAVAPHNWKSLKKKKSCWFLAQFRAEEYVSLPRQRIDSHWFKEKVWMLHPRTRTVPLCVLFYSVYVAVQRSYLPQTQICHSKAH
jgi:hypothetical protein